MREMRHLAHADHISGLVVARLLLAAREAPGSNPRCRQFNLVILFNENHCDTQLWAQAAYLLQFVG